MRSISDILRQKKQYSIAHILARDNIELYDFDFFQSVSEFATPEFKPDEKIDLENKKHTQNTDWIVLDSAEGQELLREAKLRQDLDFNQHKGKKFVEESGTEFPPNPVEGQRFRKNGILYIYRS